MWPYNRKFNFILNVAIGGGFGGYASICMIFSQSALRTAAADLASALGLSARWRHCASPWSTRPKVGA